MEGKLNNLRISGAGESSGGKFDKVTVSGSGDIKGDVECNEFHASGASDLSGNLRAKYVESSGASDIRGNVWAEEIRTSGACDIRGDVNTETICIDGASDIKGSLYAKKVEIHGASDVKGDCEADEFIAEGAFDIGGLLNADNIRVALRGKCRVREMGGETIEVKRHDTAGGIVSRLLGGTFKTRQELIVTIIEGDTIYLENTTARIVRGKDVTIGYGCNIDLIEYSGSINVAENSNVKEQKKVD